MPKALKWGIIIAACMLLLFAAGHIFHDHIGAVFGKVYQSLTVDQETDVPLSESMEMPSPWETEIHSTDVGENK